MAKYTLRGHHVSNLFGTKEIARQYLLDNLKPPRIEISMIHPDYIPSGDEEERRRATTIFIQA